MADLLEHADRIDDAIKCSREVVTAMSQHLDSEEPSLFEARNDLIYHLLRADLVSEALVESEQLVADTTRVLGPNHPISRDAEHRRIDALIGLDRIDDGIQASENLLSLALESPAADDQMGTYAWNWHVHTLWGVEKYDDAIAAFRSCLEHAIRLQGDQHFSVCILRSDLIDLLHDADRVAEALTESEKLVDDATEQFGPEDRMTRRFVEQKKELESGQSR